MVVPPLLTELSFVISNAVTRSVSVFTARFLAKTARNDKRAYHAITAIVAIQLVADAPRFPRNTKVNTNPAINPPMCAM